MFWSGTPALQLIDPDNITQDDDVNRKILERRLKLDGHEVISDTNGQEAVDRIREDPNFDCILMDIQ
jgi:CheY-like chemotaxis protein